MMNPGPVPAPQRLLSLDVVRGITIAFMIMVNNNGGSGSWRFMNHADWNGLTPTDLVFPTFLFIVGVSAVFAFEARLARGATRTTLALHTVKRAAILILLGVVVNGFPFFALEHLRIYGVLQRIAICYLAVGLFYLWDQSARTKIVALAAILAGYWILVRWIPVPGAGLPVRDVPLLDPDRNIVAWLDRHLMPGHLYEDWTFHSMRDPEGLLSSLPAIGTALLGMLTGMWLRTPRSLDTKAAGLVAACVACLGTGYLWSIWLPLNKKMWTSSYVLVAAGWSLALLAATYWAVERKGWRKGWTWPWVVFGSNAIVAYMLSELLASSLWVIAVDAGDHLHETLQLFLFARIFAPLPDRGWAAFAWSVSFTAVCFIPAWLLYRKRIWIKI